MTRYIPALSRRPLRLFHLLQKLSVIQDALVVNGKRLRFPFQNSHKQLVIIPAVHVKPAGYAGQGRKSSKCNTKIMEHFGR